MLPVPDGNTHIAALFVEYDAGCMRVLYDLKGVQGHPPLVQAKQT